MTTEETPLKLPPALETFVRRGVYTLVAADVRTIGITASQLHRWKRRGFLRALGAGSYVIAAPLVSVSERTQIAEEHLRRCRAVIDATDGAFLTARSAALAHGLPVYSHPQEVEFSRRPWMRSRREDLLARRPWGDGGVVLPDGLVAHGVAEAIVEISGRHGCLAGLVTADAALHAGAVTHAEIDDAVRRYGNRIGVADARVVAGLADARIESPAESTCRWGLHYAGIAVIPQVDIYDADGVFIGRADFVAAEAPVVIEVDGLEKYRDPDEVARQERRQRRLEEMGYVVIRVRTADLHALHHVIEAVRAAIRAAVAA